MKVVIVDDHAAVRESLRLILEYHPDLEWVGEAVDGLEALDAVHSLQPDLLLLDIRMPEMSGLEVLDNLRRAKNAVAVIILSNYADVFAVDAAMQGGANAFVIKASGFEVLKEAIHAVRIGREYRDPNLSTLTAQSDHAREGGSRNPLSSG